MFSVTVGIVLFKLIQLHFLARLIALHCDGQAGQQFWTSGSFCTLSCIAYKFSFVTALKKNEKSRTSSIKYYIYRWSLTKLLFTWQGENKRRGQNVVRAANPVLLRKNLWGFITLRRQYKIKADTRINKCDSVGQ